MMKTNILWSFLLLMLPLGIAESNDFYSIQIKKVPLREKPSYLGAIATVANYGDQVTKLNENKTWFKIKMKNSSEGWIPQSALSKKNVKFNLNSVNQDKPKKKSFGSFFSKKNETSGSEIAMAGKAWDKDIPLQGITDYSKVDQMEAYQIEPQECINYLSLLTSQGVEK